MASGRAWIIIPSQGLDRGKTRLAPVLDSAARRRLSGQWLRHVVRTARSVAGAGRCLVVSRSGEVLGLAGRLGVRARQERGAGLNTAVSEAVRHARRQGADSILVLHGDLPGLTRMDLVTVLNLLSRQSGVVLAPDRDGAGTNALALRSARRFEFHFGSGSFAKHRSEARRCRIRARIVRRPGLAHDIDLPEHYQAIARAPRARAVPCVTGRP
jgi:2-phospho-L-lactate guanylyltransferase